MTDFKFTSLSLKSKLNLKSFFSPLFFILQESFLESDLNRNPQNYKEVGLDFTDWHQETPWWREFENV